MDHSRWLVDEARRPEGGRWSNINGIEISVNYNDAVNQKLIEGWRVSISHQRGGIFFRSERVLILKGFGRVLIFVWRIFNLRWFYFFPVPVGNWTFWMDIRVLRVWILDVSVFVIVSLWKKFGFPFKGGFVFDCVSSGVSFVFEEMIPFNGFRPLTAFRRWVSNFRSKNYVMIGYLWNLVMGLIFGLFVLIWFW